MAKRVGVDVARTCTVVTGGSHRVVQVRTARPDGWTPARRKTFLTALSMTCNVTSSSAAAGMNRHSAGALRQRDPLFAAQWAEAMASGYDRLEEGLLAAAIAGLNAATALREGKGCRPIEDETADGGGGGAEGQADGFDEPGICGAGSDGAGIEGAGSEGGAGSAMGFRLASMQAVQVALALLARRSADMRGGGGRGCAPYRRATKAETDASIAKKLDSLAQRLRGSTEGGAA